MLQRDLESACLSTAKVVTRGKEKLGEDRIVRAAIYARTARIDQNAKYAEQVKRCSDYIKQKGWILCDVFFDEGVSGRAIDRPELSKMLLNIAKDCFDVVVVSNADRLSRSLKDLSEISKILNDFHVKVRSTAVTENEALYSDQLLFI